MPNIESFLHLFKQNNKLPIRLISPSFGYLPPEIVDIYRPTLRTPYYFLLFMVEGLPHQIHHPPPTKQGADYYKLGFDDNSLSLLPKQYPFLINPFNNQKIQFTPSAAARLKSIFEILLGLLSEMDTNPELILAHLNSLLTEINTAYFSTHKSPADDNLRKYIRFRLFVENNLTDHLTIIDIAEKLALNTNSLYNIVKHYSGLSPKESIATIERALELGHNFLDTADYYRVGHNEELISQASRANVTKPSSL